jgi:hypothetical protein
MMCSRIELDFREGSQMDENYRSNSDASELMPFVFLSNLLDEVSDFRSPVHLRNVFDRVHGLFYKEPLLPSLSRLKLAENRTVDWLHKFQNAVSNLRLSMAVPHYHLTNIERIESSIIETSMRLLPSYGPKKNASVGGPILMLDYEYQAFLLALRRCLEHFAVSIGAYFKRDVHRIRALGKAIQNATPEADRMPVLQELENSLEQLSEDVLPPKEHRRTPRDRLAHHEYVFATYFSVGVYPDNRVSITFFNRDEHFIKLNQHTKRFRSITIDQCKRELHTEDGKRVEVYLLSPVLRNQLERVEELVFGHTG